MTAALKWNLVSVEDYLADELRSENKHEYLGGVVYAMAGARVVHNDIATNIVVAVGSRLRGKRCKVYTPDMKVRIQLDKQIRFYYPDASVIGHSNPGTDSFQDEPAAIFEVLSKSTRRIDTGEKNEGYLAIPSLQTYLLIEQEMPLVVLFRRKTNGFEREVYEGLAAVISLPEIDIELPLAEIYEGVPFVQEPDNEDVR